jgi:hypothetical protein
MNRSQAVCSPAQTGPDRCVTLNVLETLESFMNRAHTLVIAAGLLVSGQVIVAQEAQELSRYRAYVLESSVATVATAIGPRIGSRAIEAGTVHERPAKIQELQWRAPYVSPGSASADPVREIAFTFVNDALYQVLVTYDRERTAGLTNDDIIQFVSVSYGTPVVKSTVTRTDLPAGVLDNAIVLAQWSDAASSLTLLRDMYSPDFQLVLISKALSARARSAIREAIRLDALEAPQRELEKRRQDVAEASAARDKARATNKAAFHP